ncbi:MAG: hypothetical protein JXE07_04805 [Candidatus Aminicenantes bacterium]|nr:hypothetical protein [Candidatus Aminicenantes bacterium]
MNEPRPISEDGRCPFCRSEYVIKKGGLWAHPVTISESPRRRFFVYTCFTCNKEFLQPVE